MHYHYPGIGWFARHILGMPLYPYQELVGNAILDSVLYRRGYTFTVMFARQMGKNHLSAVLEAYLLALMDEGTIIKAAPTFKPQIINSRLRLLKMLENPFFASHVWRSCGYIVGVAPTKKLRMEQGGPRVMFFSAGSDSSIVGATASLLLEVDEAQAVDIDKFNRDLRPMASTSNATTVLYGTAWTSQTLLATMQTTNLELEQRDGIQRHFEYDWRTLAQINPHYQRFVRREIERLGENNRTIRTQYKLQPITGDGSLLDDVQHLLLQGSHDWEMQADEHTLYIAGMDVGGEERSTQVRQQNLFADQTDLGQDSTVITIARIRYNELQLPCLEIVHHYWWTGKPFQEQYAAALSICAHWNIRRLVIDRTGLGNMMASLLQNQLGSECIVPFHFSRSSKSALTYHFLGLIDSGRLKLPLQPDKKDKAYTIVQECWKQLRSARYCTPALNMLTMYADKSDGHDDFLISLALCCEGIHNLHPFMYESRIINPLPLYQDESRF